MSMKNKTGGRHPRQIGGALGNVEDSIAIPAVKMMMVRLSGDLVASRFPGKADLDQPGLIDERPQVTVDGGDAQTGDDRSRGLVNLHRAQRPAGVVENAAEGRTLFGSSCHEGGLFDNGLSLSDPASAVNGC